ncbi:MAG: aryl-sulfate sulfotransferase [Planctomycetota bacterium]
MPRPLFHLAAPACLMLSVVSPLPAQGPADGLRFFEATGEGIDLVDPNGTIVHHWITNIQRHGGIALDAQGALYHGFGSGFRKRSLGSGLLWSYNAPAQYAVSHDLQPLPNGNVLLMAGELKTSAEVAAAGRDPLTTTPTVEYGVILELQQTGPNSGTVVWEWHVFDHLVQDFDATKANFGVVQDRWERVDANYPSLLFQGNEFNHFNGLDYDPIHDWILISSPVQDEVWIIDHSTTTAEAAGSTGGRWGKGGDLLYRWGNPAVYRAGPASAVQLGFQHDPRFVPPGYPGEGNVLIFSNNPTGTQSEVLEIGLPVDSGGAFIKAGSGPFGPAQPVWSYAAPGFHSPVMSGAQRLPNGNTLICSATQTTVFEITPAGTKVWERVIGGTNPVFQAHFTERTMWANREDMPATGANALFALEAGSAFAGDIYAVLGSASGTSPGFTLQGTPVPLNFDTYTLGMLRVIGAGPLQSWAGVLDSTGGGRASFNLTRVPPGVIGLTVHHAMCTLDATTGALVAASNAVPLAFVP